MKVWNYRLFTYLYFMINNKNNEKMITIVVKGHIGGRGRKRTLSFKFDTMYEAREYAATHNLEDRIIDILS